MPPRREPETVDEYECATCGSSVGADATECPVCGEKFEESSPGGEPASPPPGRHGGLPLMGPWKAPPKTAEATPPATDAKTPVEGSPGRVKVLAAAVAVIAILLVGVLGWGFLQFGAPAPPGGPAAIVQGITPSSFSTDATAHDVPMPATVNVGDLLIVFLANDGTPNVATPGGWTFFFGWNSWGGATTKFSMYAKRANGTEGGTTVNFATTVAERAAAQVYRITSWRDTGTLANDVEVNVTGSTDANPDPLPLDPANWGAERTLWIAAFGAEGDPDATAYPANFTGGTYTESDVSATSASLGSAYRTATGAAEDPGTFTIASSSFWIACTVAVRLA